MVCDAPRSSKSQGNGPFYRSVWQGLKPGPHDVMLHTCDGASKRGCNASKSRVMCCDRKLLNICGLLYCDGNFISFRLICDSNFPVEYFQTLSLR